MKWFKNIYIGGLRKGFHAARCKKLQRKGKLLGARLTLPLQFFPQIHQCRTRNRVVGIDQRLINVLQARVHQTFISRHDILRLHDFFKKGQNKF